MNNKNTWYRGHCKNLNGHHWSENALRRLFQFFFIDIGENCEIIETSVCELPNEIVEVEPMAIGCRINQFPEIHQAQELNQYFHELTGQNPLGMKICSKDGQFQSVDLFQFATQPNEDVVSVRGALLQRHQMRYNSSGILKREIAIQRGDCLRATVVNFVPTNEIYIEIEETQGNVEQHSALMGELNTENNSDLLWTVPEQTIGKYYL